MFLRFDRFVLRLLEALRFGLCFDRFVLRLLEPPLKSVAGSGDAEVRGIFL